MTDAPRPDPRNVGFRDCTPVAEVISLLRDRLAGPNRSESVVLRELHDRVLAEDIVAPIDVPRFDRAAMDGYALLAEDTLGASTTAPRELEVVGTAWPGRPHSGAVTPGRAVRIMTGAPIPDGADAVLPVESTAPLGPLTARPTERVAIHAEIARGRHVARRGEDITTGARLLSKGRRLRPQDLGCLSSLGIDRADVVRRPTVEIIVTGNEVLPAGTRPTGFHITDANSPLLVASVRRDGGLADEPRFVRDVREELVATLRETKADVVLITGGSSVGDEDHVPSVVSELGELLVHGIEMRPGKPAGVGWIDGRSVFLIPGNPVACLAVYDVLIGPTLRRLGGRAETWPHRVKALPLASEVISKRNRLDYVRARIVGDGIEPLGAGGASKLATTTLADGVFLVPADIERLAPQTPVDVYLYDL